MDSGGQSPDAKVTTDAGKDAAKDAAKDTGTTTDGGKKDTGTPGDTGAGDTGTDTGTPGDTGVDTGASDSSTKPDTNPGFDAAPPTGCGNGTIDGTEECDDGNVLDLDGCDSQCNYETITRMTSIQISGSAAPSFCVHTGNALGAKALSSTALNQLNPALATDVTNGTVNVFTQFLQLSDLTGTAATGFELGVLDGNLDPVKGTWPTTGNPIDWWFLADPTAVANGLPTGLLTGGAIAAHALTAGPSTVNVVLNLGGSPADLTMRDAKVAATIGTATDTPAPPPAKLATGLEVLETITANATGQGLCGDITVQSLAQIPIPSALTTGTADCSEGYTYCGANMPVSASCNSLLDVLVGGCKVLGGLVTVITATQPDVAPTGGSSVTALTVGTLKKVTIPAAAETEAYSAYLTFQANRAHFTGEYCTATTDCQTGQTCGTVSGETSKVCTPQ